MRQQCISADLDQMDLDRLDRIIRPTPALLGGQWVYRHGDPFEALYVLRSGSAKTVRLAVDGTEQIVDFHLPGDVMGLDSLGRGHYQSSLRVLERASLCCVPAMALDDLMVELPRVGQRLLRVLSRALNDEGRRMLVLAHRSAEARFAAFLLDLSGRLLQRGFYHTEFYLSMPRMDISNHLGLTPETLSRIIARFQQQGLARIHKRHVTLLDVSGLRGLVLGTDAELPLAAGANGLH